MQYMLDTLDQKEFRKHGRISPQYLQLRMVHHSLAGGLNWMFNKYSFLQLVLYILLFVFRCSERIVMAVFNFSKVHNPKISIFGMLSFKP